MRRRVQLLALTSMLISLCIPMDAQQPQTPVQGVVAHIDDSKLFPDSLPPQYRLPEGMTVEDVIRKLPGVEVLSDGSITVDGRLVSKIRLSNQLEAVGSTLQDDIFGLRIGMPVSEQEIVKLFSERYNAHVDIPSREASIVYHVRNIQYLGFDWNHVFLYVDKDDNTLKSVSYLTILISLPQKRIASI